MTKDTGTTPTDLDDVDLDKADGGFVAHCHLTDFKASDAPVGVRAGGGIETRVAESNVNGLLIGGDGADV